MPRNLVLRTQNVKNDSEYRLLCFEREYSECETQTERVFTERTDDGKSPLSGIGWENCFNVFGTLLEMSWLRT